MFLAFSLAVFFKVSQAFAILGILGHVTTFVLLLVFTLLPKLTGQRMALFATITASAVSGQCVLYIHIYIERESDCCPIVFPLLPKLTGQRMALFATITASAVSGQCVLYIHIYIERESDCCPIVFPLLPKLTGQRMALFATITATTVSGQCVLCRHGNCPRIR